MKKLTLAVIVLITITATINAQAPTGLHTINTFHIASPGGWDYLAIGPVNGWL